MKNNIELIIDKGFNKGIKISTSEYNGYKYLSINDLWRSSEDEDWKFNKKSITIPPKHIKEVITFLKENEEDIYKTLEVES